MEIIPENGPCKGDPAQMKIGLILRSSSVKIGWVRLVEWSEGQ